MKKDKLESLFHEFKQLELQEESMRLIQGGANSATATAGRNTGDSCGTDPCCTETAQQDCCTNQDTGNLPLGDCDTGDSIADFCV